jgi:hypothetical protein
VRLLSSAPDRAAWREYGYQRIGHRHAVDLLSGQATPGGLTPPVRCRLFEVADDGNCLSGGEPEVAANRQKTMRR